MTNEQLLEEGRIRDMREDGVCESAAVPSTTAACPERDVDLQEQVRRVAQGRSGPLECVTPGCPAVGVSRRTASYLTDHGGSGTITEAPVNA